MDNQEIQNVLILSKEGDLYAFQQLVKHYQGYALLLAIRLLNNEEDAKDVVQETFLRVWKHLKNYNPCNKFSTWLYKIVTNLCYDRLKSKKRKERVFVRDCRIDIMDITQDCCDLEEDCIKKDLVITIVKLAEELTPKQRIIFILRDLQDLSIKEVAKISGMRESSIKTNLYYARRNIREKLQQMSLIGGKKNEV